MGKIYANISERIGRTPLVRLNRLAKGLDADVTVKLPVARLGGLLTKYGSRLHSDPSPVTRWMFLNTRVPPFDDVEVARAALARRRTGSRVS